jgi:hypothetical protein
MREGKHDDKGREADEEGRGDTNEGEGRGDGGEGRGEGKDHGDGDADEFYMFEEEGGRGKDELEDEGSDSDEFYMFEKEKKDDDDGDDEMVQVDERMLVQELRRARRLMNESRKREQAKKQKLQEMQLKGIIDQEVKNVLKELQLNSGWVYGKNKPTKSRKGYTHQGSFLKGIGFK